MATTIPDHYTTQFSSSWQHQFQQMESRLKDKVTVDTITGKEKKYNQLGAGTARLITDRNGVTEPDNIAKEARWIRPKGYDEVEWWDEFDEQLLGEVVLPTSQTAKAHAMAFARQCDDTLIAAMGGTNYIGADGLTTETFDTTDQQIAASSADLTLAKLIEAKEIFWGNEAYDEDSGDELCIALGSYQMRSLIEDAIEVQSSDYNDVKALVEGRVRYFMGMKFIRTERLTKTGNNREVLVWIKSNVVLGIGKEKKAKFTIRDDRNETLQLRTVMSIGATRLQNGAVVKILCDETA